MMSTSNSKTAFLIKKDKGCPSLRLKEKMGEKRCNIKTIKTRETIEVCYENISMPDSERRIADAYEMIFAEIEKNKKNLQNQDK